MTSHEPDPIAQHARDVFEAASGDVDPTTAGRLRLARRAALSAPPSPRAWLAPLAGAVAVALAAWLAWPRTQAPATAPAPVATTPAAPATNPPIVPEPPEIAPPDESDAQPLVETPADELLEEESLAHGDPAWADLDDEDAELYAWLADAPVAPDTEGDAL